MEHRLRSSARRPLARRDHRCYHWLAHRGRIVLLRRRGGREWWILRVRLPLDHNRWISSQFARKHGRDGIDCERKRLLDRGRLGEFGPREEQASTAPWPVSRSMLRSPMWSVPPTVTVIGWSCPMAAPLPSGMRRSTAQWAADRSTNRSSISRRHRWTRLLDGRVRRGHLRLRGRAVLRLDGRGSAQGARRGNGRRSDHWRLLAGCIRRGHLRLPRALLRIDRRPSSSNSPVNGMASAHDGIGYWRSHPTGASSPSATAAFDGSMGVPRLVAPIVGIAADPATGGYWLVASDGGVFAFDARFFGSGAG